MLFKTTINILFKIITCNLKLFCLFKIITSILFKIISRIRFKIIKCYHLTIIASVLFNIITFYLWYSQVFYVILLHICYLRKWDLPVTGVSRNSKNHGWAPQRRKKTQKKYSVYISMALFIDDNFSLSSSCSGVRMTHGNMELSADSSLSWYRRLTKDRSVSAPILSNSRLQTFSFLAINCCFLSETWSVSDLCHNYLLSRNWSMFF